MTPFDRLKAKVELDPTAAFEPKTLKALGGLKVVNIADYQKVREMIKDNLKSKGLRIRDFDDAVDEQRRAYKKRYDKARDEMEEADNELAALKEQQTRGLTVGQGPEG